MVRLFYAGLLLSAYLNNCCYVDVEIYLFLMFMSPFLSSWKDLFDLLQNRSFQDDRC